MMTGDLDVSAIPYRILIRIRTQAEFDKAVLYISRQIAATALSGHTSEKLAPVIQKAIAKISLHESKENRAPSASSVVTALQALADFDECGTPPRRWPWPWPWPWMIEEKNKPEPDPWRELGYLDIVGLKTITSLATLISAEFGQDIAKSSQSIIENMAAG